MKDVVLKLENLFTKAGYFHYYQYSITFLFIILYCCTHFINYFLPYLERVPTVIMKETGIEQAFDYKLCGNRTSYEIIDEEKLLTSIVYEFDIVCSKKKNIFFRTLLLCRKIDRFFHFLFIFR